MQGDEDKFSHWAKDFSLEEDLLGVHKTVNLKVIDNHGLLITASASKRGHCHSVPPSPWIRFCGYNCQVSADIVSPR